MQILVSRYYYIAKLYYGAMQRFRQDKNSVKMAITDVTMYFRHNYCYHYCCYGCDIDTGLYKARSQAL